MRDRFMPCGCRVCKSCKLSRSRSDEMKHRLMRVIAPLLCLATIASATMAYGQVTTSLSGTVTDTSGAVLPGADIVAKSDDTGVTFTAVANDRGYFSIPAMSVGKYTVTVSLQGFKQVVL